MIDVDGVVMGGDASNVYNTLELYQAYTSACFYNFESVLRVLILL